MLNILAKKEACVAIGFSASRLLGDDLYIANVYASNKVYERLKVWEAMVNCLLRGQVDLQEQLECG